MSATEPIEGSQRRPGKAAILRAAVEVMGEDGYEGASMRGMAARAGVSVAALYHHFPSKEALLAEFLDEAFRITVNRIERRLEGLVDPVDRLATIAATLAWSHLHDEFAQKASIVASREHTRLSGPPRKVVERHRKQLLDLVEGVIVAGVADGSFTTDEPREAARAVITLTTVVVGPFHEMRRSLDDALTIYQRLALAVANA